MISPFNSLPAAVQGSLMANGVVIAQGLETAMRTAMNSGNLKGVSQYLCSQGIPEHLHQEAGPQLLVGLSLHRAFESLRQIFFPQAMSKETDLSARELPRGALLADIIRATHRRIGRLPAELIDKVDILPEAAADAVRELCGLPTPEEVRKAGSKPS